MFDDIPAGFRRFVMNPAETFGERDELRKAAACERSSEVKAKTDSNRMLAALAIQEYHKLSGNFRQRKIP